MKRLILTLTLALTAFPALAVDHLKPGQWDMTINMTGMGQPMHVQQCITPEQAAMKQPVNPAGDQNCTVKNYQQKGNTVSGDLICTNGMKATGRFETTMNGDTGYRSKMTLSGSSDGESMDQQIETTGKWVKDKCDPGIPGAPQ